MRSVNRIHLTLLCPSALASFLALGLTAGCTSEPPPAAAKSPEPAERTPKADAEPASAPAPVAPPPSIGSLDAEFVATISRHKSVEKIELEVGADGLIRELALYPGDADRVPSAVKDRAQEIYPGATVDGYESEVEGPDRRVVYEVELTTAEGQKCEIEATDSGELLYTECELDLSSLSDGLRAEVAKVLPDGEIKEVEVVTPAGDAKPRTSVEVIVGTATHKLVFVDGALSRHALEIKAEIELDLALPQG